MTLTYLSKQFNQLPDEGGLMNQDAYTVLGMKFTLEAEQERQELENKQQKNRQKRRRR